MSIITTPRLFIRTTFSQTSLARLAAALFYSGCVLTLLVGCDSSAESSPSRGESITGTYLEPVPGDGMGFIALDEECGNTDDPLYMNRFITTMFRDGVVVADTLYLVDGSFLWAVDISAPALPARRSLTRLSGVPIAIASDDDHTLYIAAGETGILRVDITDPAAPVELDNTPLNGPALDVVYADNLIFAVAGSGGLAVMDLAEDSGALTPLALHPLPGFPNGIDVKDGIAAISSCGLFSLVDVQFPLTPTALGHYPIATAHAKDVTLHQNHAFVSAGEALFAFDISNPAAASAKGYYADPEAEGFYVNGAEAFENTIFIAAGDESVRVINVSEIANQQGEEPQQWDETADEVPELNGPYQFPEVTVNEGFTTVHIYHGDPINVIRQDSALFVLGNFRWVGERLVRLFSIQPDGSLNLVSEYEQPQEASFFAASDTRLVRHTGGDTLEITVVDSAQQMAAYSETATLTELPVRASFFEETTFILTEAGNLFSHQPDVGLSQTSAVSGVTDFAMQADGTVYYSSPLGNRIYSQAPGDSPRTLISEDNHFWGFSRLHLADNLLYAYDPYTGILFQTPTDSASAVQTHFVGLCENYQLDDFYNSANESTAQLIAQADYLYLLCPNNENDVATVLKIASANLHVASTIALPPGMYRSLQLLTDQLFALRTDNNAYTFTIVSLDDAGATAETTVTGYATSMAVHNGLLVVGDNDQGVRTFTVPLQGAVEEITDAPLVGEVTL